MPPLVGKSSVRGAGEIRRQLGNLIKNLPWAVAHAARDDFEVDKLESMRRTPWQTRALQKSHKVHPPTISGGVIHSMISVGDETTNDKGVRTDQYAIPVHEDLEAFHREGQAKFLESTLMESAPYKAERIAKRVDARRAMRG